MLRRVKYLDCIQPEGVRAAMQWTELQMMVIVKTSTSTIYIPFLINDRRVFVTAVMADDDLIIIIHNNN